LQAKMVLAAERIASKPSLLILDEPSRKLCKPLAIELIAAICEQAHKQNIPVLIISHQTDWWTGIAQSRLLFERLPNGTTKIKLVEGP
jgi:ABC-type glutathione transport system ATPase component